MGETERSLFPEDDQKSFDGAGTAGQDKKIQEAVKTILLKTSKEEASKLEDEAIKQASSPLFPMTGQAIAKEAFDNVSQETLREIDGKLGTHLAADDEPGYCFQIELLDVGEWWHDLWKGMPEFVQEDLEPMRTIYVHFDSNKSVKEFFRLVGQKVPANKGSIWFPQQDVRRFANKIYVDPRDGSCCEPAALEVPPDGEFEESEFDTVGTNDETKTEG